MAHRGINIPIKKEKKKKHESMKTNNQHDKTLQYIYFYPLTNELSTVCNCMYSMCNLGLKIKPSVRTKHFLFSASSESPLVL